MSPLPLLFEVDVGTLSVVFPYFLGCKLKLLPPYVHILRLKCTKSNSGLLYAPDTAGELTALPRSLSGFKGDILLRAARGWKRN